MEQFLQLLGCEKSLHEVSQALYFHARNLDCAGVGALQITCADESESECVEAFQHGFVQYLLPQLKSARHSSFRLANLGGRYEWGAVRLAERNFATPASEDACKLLLTKINAHVACEPVGGGPVTGSATASDPPFRLGIRERYGKDSACCGALKALLDGHDAVPAVAEMREAFLSEGLDRIDILRDERRVAPLYRPLVAARLQARKVVLDIQDYHPPTATLFLVVPCVTINRRERDTEIVCGIYAVDGRAGGHEATYTGLGDDPSRYGVRIRNRLFVVSDEQLGRRRSGRDHRALVRQEWRSRSGARSIDVHDDRLERIRRDVARNRHRHHGHARQLLRAALPVLAEVAPIPAAVLMFADGAAGIHHTFRVHRLARTLSGSHEARQILDEIHARVDQLEPDHAAALIEMLMGEYSP